jgi:hypothetical protein
MLLPSLSLPSDEGEEGDDDDDDDEDEKASSLFPWW